MSFGIPSRLVKLAQSGFWTATESLSYPLLMFVALPVYVTELGISGYGTIVLTTAVAGLGGIANFGATIATQKYVSMYRGQSNQSAMVTTVQQSIAVVLLGGSAVAGIVVASAPWLATNVFQHMGQPDVTIAALTYAALMLIVQQADSVFSSTLRGAEQFTTAAHTEIVTKLGLLIAALSTAVISKQVSTVLLVMLAASILGMLVKAIAASRAVGGRVYLPVWPDRRFREAAEFGFWNWAQAASALLFQHADRLIIGAVFGTAPLAFYAATVHLAQQVHALPAAVFGFLFPLSSRMLSEGKNASVVMVSRLATLLNVAFVFVLGLCLILAGEIIMRWWMGEEFAAQVGKILTVLVLAYSILGINVTAHYMLLGYGDAKYVAIANIVGAALVVSASVILIPAAGLIGAAVARALYGPTTLVCQIRLWRKTRGK